MDKIIIIAKDSHELGILKKEVSFEVVEYDSIVQKKEWTEEKLKSSDSRLFLLVHFLGNANTENELCDKIKPWKQEINKENVVIIPISGYTGTGKANELYEIVKKSESPDILNLDYYKEYWEKKCGDYFKKKIIFGVLSFCLYCENAYKFDTFEKHKGKIEDSLIIAIKVLEEGDIWKENTEVKDTLKDIINLLNEQGKLKDEETKKFIDKKVKVGVEENSVWLELLKNLKKWVKKDSENAQKQQDCCR